jgi:hypothetical protein
MEGNKMMVTAESVIADELLNREVSGRSIVNALATKGYHLVRTEVRRDGEMKAVAK